MSKRRRLQHHSCECTDRYCNILDCTSTSLQKFGLLSCQIQNAQDRTSWFYLCVHLFRNTTGSSDSWDLWVWDWGHLCESGIEGIFVRAINSSFVINHIHHGLLNAETRVFAHSFSNALILLEYGHCTLQMRWVLLFTRVLRHWMQVVPLAQPRLDQC